MGNTDAMDLLMSIDDAVQVIDPSDQQKIKAVQERVKVQRHELATYTKDWQAKPAVVKGSAPELVSVKAKAKARKASSAGQRVWPDRIPVGDLTQAELAALTPPNGHIWHDRRSGGWQAHFPPFPRVNRLWHMHGGCRPAAILCLRYLWEKWCIVNGVDQARCPIGDLWSCSVASEQPLPTGSASSNSQNVQG